MKNQKGITLVALIITIIVMLILVSVSISIALNNNLFKTTANATDKTNQALTNEQHLSSGYVNMAGGAQNLDINAVDMNTNFDA